MGLDYYDRPVISSGGGSSGNDVVGQEKKLNKALDPKTYIVGDEPIISQTSNPIVMALDVTGSMGEWPKIIYDKLPMFYGQIKSKDYLQNPSLSFCAIGDVTSDEAPLQVTRFGEGKAIDELISKIWLEGGGGGNQHESYELSAYFYNHYVKNPQSEMAFFFVTGDEGYFTHPKTNQYFKVLGDKPAGEVVDAPAEWRRLMESYNVFHLKKEYDNEKQEVKINKQWVDTLGEDRVLHMRTPKACIDVMLGAICITSGVRTLETYVKDMEDRGQDKARIEEVVGALKRYDDGIQTKRIKPVVQKSIIDEVSEKYRKLGLEVSESHNKYREDLVRMKEAFKGEIPQTFYCPITREIFFDPVMTCDGQTYERQAVSEWLKTHDTSPLTGMPLANKTLMPNIIIKKLINQFHDKVNKK